MRVLQSALATELSDMAIRATALAPRRRLGWGMASTLGPAVALAQVLELVVEQAVEQAAAPASVEAAADVDPVDVEAAMAVRLQALAFH